MPLGVLTVLAAPLASPERECAAEPPTSSTVSVGKAGQLREGTAAPEAVCSCPLFSDAERLAELPRRGRKRVSGPDPLRGH